MMPVLFGRRLGHDPVLSRPVRHKSLQLSDRDRFALDSSDADALALILLRTDAAADRRKTGRFRYDLCGAFDISLDDLLNEGRNIDRYGTALDAFRILAV